MSLYNHPQKIKSFSFFSCSRLESHTHTLKIQKRRANKIVMKVGCVHMKKSEFIAASFMCCFLSVLRVSIISSFLFSYSKLFNLSRCMLIMNSKKAFLCHRAAPVYDVRCSINLSWAWFTFPFAFVAYSPTNNIF